MKSLALIAFHLAICTPSLIAAPETSPRSTISLSHISVKGKDWYSIKVSGNKSQMQIVVRNRQIDLLDVPQNFDYTITLDYSKNEFYKSIIAFWKDTSSGRTLVDAIGISNTGKVEFASKAAFENLQSQIKAMEDKIKPFLDRIGLQRQPVRAEQGAAANP